MDMKKFITFVLLCSSAVFAFGAELSASSKAEIDSLLTALESSQCQFYRNGSWYSASEARAHLKQKYDYLVNASQIANAEEFISAAATKSSMSGEPYQVGCPGQTPQASAVWIGNELQRLRALRAYR